MINTTPTLYQKLLTLAEQDPDKAELLARQIYSLSLLAQRKLSAEELEQLKSAGEQYQSLLMQSIGDRLVEAASEWLHREVRTK